MQGRAGFGGAGGVVVGLRLAVVLGLASVASGALAAEYQAALGPMPLDDETKQVIAGRGEVKASLQGRTLTVNGSYRGLPSPATRARLWESPAIGVPGKPVLDLRLSGGPSGTVSGTLRLSAAQLRTVRTGRLYIQLDSEQAPPGYPWGPKGTLWGWLLTAHAVAKPGEPQQGAWFIPQLDMPAR